MNGWQKVKRFAVKLSFLSQKAVRKFTAHFYQSTSVLTGVSLPPDRAHDLDKMVVVITGSSRGIGLTLAEIFLEAGSAVVINGRQKEALDAAAGKLKTKYSKFLAVAADVADPLQAKRLVDESLQQFGRIDVLINNAAVPGPMDKKIWDVSPEEFQTVMQANVTAPFLCAREVIRWANSQEHPVRIINVSSGIVGHGAPRLGPYAVSKMGLEGLTLAINADSAADHPLVSVVSIKPRSVTTAMTKAYFSAADYAFMDDPKVLAQVFRYAASAPAADIMGRSLSEPAFAADPQGEIILNNAFAAVKPFRIQPETFRPENAALDQSGAYMHLLQNPFGFYPSVAEAIRAAVNSREVFGYPDPNYTALRQALSARLKLPPEYFTFAPGSSELIDRALRVFSQPRAHIIVTQPTWGSVVWPAILKYGYQATQVPYLGDIKQKNLRHDLDGILKSINVFTRLIYLVNPCNPTGSMVSRQELKHFLENVPRHVTVLLDEAYLDYAQPDKCFNLPEAIDRLPGRVIGLRTFSKFFALSGFRIGYAYGRPEVLDYLNRLELPFNVNHISQLAAVTALQDNSAQEKTYANNHHERQRICSELETLKIANLPSQASFVLFESPLDRGAMRAALKQQGIFMPNVDAAFTQNYAITAVGLPEHNQKILDYLRTW